MLLATMVIYAHCPDSRTPDMSPRAPETSTGMDEIGPNCTGEQAIICLVTIQRRGSSASLPQGVISYINPYLWEPCNLPERIWYFVDSEAPEQEEPPVVGFWKAKGDPCLIYPDLDSASCSVIGLRTTLEFYQGLSPNPKRTDWVMEDYSISHNGSIEAAKGARSSLCRVFRSDRQGKFKKPDQHPSNEALKVQINLVPDADNEPGKPLKSKLPAKMERLQAIPPYQGGNLLHADYGDFFELDDLDNPQPSSSSSQNSSCVTPLSDVYCDSDALPGTNLSSNKFTISSANDMILTVTTEGSPISGYSNTVEPTKVEALEAALALESKQPEKNHIPEDAKTQPPSTLHYAGTSTSRQMPRDSKGKKVYSGKTIKKFFCFIA